MKPISNSDYFDIYDHIVYGHQKIYDEDIQKEIISLSKNEISPTYQIIIIKLAELHKLYFKSSYSGSMTDFLLRENFTKRIAGKPTSLFSIIINIYHEMKITPRKLSKRESEFFNRIYRNIKNNVN